MQDTSVLFYAAFLQRGTGMKKRNKRVLFSMMAAMIAAITVTGSLSTAAASVNEAQQTKKQLQSSLEDTQDLISSLRSSREGIKEKTDQLDREMTSVSEKITDLNKKIKETDQEITETEKKLKEAQKTEKSQYEAMKQRIRYSYENYNGNTILTALLESDSFADFLNYAECMNEMMKYDRAQLDAYARTRQLIEDSGQKLKQDRQKLNEMNQQLQEEKKSVELLMKEKQKQLKEVNSQISEKEIQAAEYKAEIESQDRIIEQIRAAEEKKKKEQKAMQEAEARAEKTDNEKSENVAISSSDIYDGGEFLWPCPASQRVTSEFGYRNSPTPGASSYHQGLDIGAPYGASIVAAADGVVFTADYQPNGAGNYVVLSHGGGLYTVYMHCSSLAVSEGQQVKRGQTIAYVGSTGISTGNHLHFGVQLGGKYVNPWTYLK